MIKRLAGSFLLALQNIRSNFFHTLLSILGIVIGVAALVIILSMIDGMEEFANRELSSTTSLKTILIQTNTHKQVNGVQIKKDTFSMITHDLFRAMNQRFSDRATFYLRSTKTSEVKYSRADSTAAALVNAISPSLPRRFYVSAGRLFNVSEVEAKAKVVVLNQLAASIFEPDSVKWKSLLGNAIYCNGNNLIIIGVVNGRGRQPEIFIPFTLLSADEVIASPPQSFAEANSVEDVQALKEEITEWWKGQVPDASDISVSTNEFRVQQAAKGFLLFRIIMGMIVGVAVLVGGIGVMNVLLISVTERTVEIGVRKAVGANRRDIVMQFLAESITVSVFGSLMGLLLGVLATMAIVPIVKMIVEVPFQAAYTWNTFLVVSSIAVLIGIIFGTYPALRASRLDPVEAIRRE